MRSQKGFTLIELMIVIAVMAIMSAFAFPAFQDWMVKNRLNGAARQVMSDLMEARMKAVKLNHRVKVFFYSVNQYKLCDDANNDGTVANGEGDVQLRDIHPDYYDVKFNLANTDDPVFSSGGTATNSTITLMRESPSGSKSITISSAGRVKIN